MIAEGLKGLEIISQAVGDCPDLVQGGGGNTSAKLNDKLMAIKASGFKLSQVNREEGFVKVDYEQILAYFQDVDTSQDKDFSSESEQMVRNNVVPDGDGEGLKPSIETGFHSVLKKYVLHTHSVYANILCCAENGEQLVSEIFATEDYDPVWIPYTHPGFYLTVKIQKAVKDYLDSYGEKPEVIFLANHGLIVNRDDPEATVKLNSEISNKLKSYLSIDDDYPRVQIDKKDEKTFVSQTQYLIDFFKNSDITEEYFDRMLYPDQIVYLGDDIVIDDENGKININTNTGEILYHTGFNEAKTIDETLTAYLYIIDQIEKNDLSLKIMSNYHINLIKEMTGESHRKDVLKEMD